MGHIVFREESWGPDVAALDPVVDANRYPVSAAPRSEYGAAHAADADASELACRHCGGELAEGLSLSGARRCTVCGKGTRAIDIRLSSVLPPEIMCDGTAECGAPCALPPGHVPPCVGSCGDSCQA